jgi:hypothetical protein
MAVLKPGRAPLPNGRGTHHHSECSPRVAALANVATDQDRPLTNRPKDHDMDDYCYTIKGQPYAQSIPQVG